MSSEVAERIAQLNVDKSLAPIRNLKQVIDFYNDPGVVMAPGLERELNRKINRAAKGWLKTLGRPDRYKAFTRSKEGNVFERFSSLVKDVDDNMASALERSKRRAPGSGRASRRAYKRALVSYQLSHYRLSKRTAENRIRAVREGLTGYLFVAPATIAVALFIAFSVIFAIVASLHSVLLSGTGLRWDFVGGANFDRAIANPLFADSIVVTLKYMAMVAPIQTVLSLILSSVLAKKMRFGKFFMVCYFLPTLTSSTALTLIFVRLFGAGGPMEEILGAGFTRQHILGLIAIMNIWSTVPFFVVVFNAAHANVSQSQYEAAAIDGAGPIQQFFKVTVQHLMPVVAFVLITGVIGTLQMFDQAYIIAQDKSIGADSSLFVTASRFIYDAAFLNLQADKGYAAAAAVLFTLIILVFSVASFFLSRRR